MNYMKGREYSRPYRQPLPKQPRKLNNWRSYVKRTFNLTLEEYESRREKQNDLCAICLKPEKEKRRLALDHCHSSGRLREFLCSNCNAGLGRFSDDPSLLIKAAEYLKKHGAV